MMYFMGLGNAITMQVDALTMQADALIIQADALLMQVDALTMQADALTMQVDALTMQADALTMQSMTKLNLLRINKMLYLVVLRLPKGCYSRGLGTGDWGLG